MKHIIYHANCPDGCCAAAVALMKMPEAKLHPANYGDPLPEGLEGEVFILDFSYPRDIMIELSKRVKLQVIDHHKTAQEACTGLDFCLFDMNHSGARLTWNYFFPGVLFPLFVGYIEDRDLWKFNLTMSREFSAGLRMEEFDPFLYMRLIYRESYKELIQAGVTALKLQRREVEEMCKRVRWLQLSKTISPCFIDQGSFYQDHLHWCYIVPCVNATINFSEVGERLLELYPDTPFAVYYFDRSDKRQWGIRARKDFDASFIAKHFGGGGHPQACGFVTDLV